MTVFIKRYPSKGELPQFKDGVYQGYFHTEFGLVKYCKYDGWKLARKCPDYFLEEIELPSDEEIDQSSNRYYFNLEEKREKSRNFKGQIAGRHPDMLTSREMLSQMSGFVDGANYILDLLKPSASG